MHNKSRESHVLRLTSSRMDRVGCLTSTNPHRHVRLAAITGTLFTCISRNISLGRLTHLRVLHFVSFGARGTSRLRSPPVGSMSCEELPQRLSPIEAWLSSYGLSFLMWLQYPVFCNCRMLRMLFLKLLPQLRRARCRFHASSRKGPELLYLLSSML